MTELIQLDRPRPARGKIRWHRGAVVASLLILWTSAAVDAAPLRRVGERVKRSDETAVTETDVAIVQQKRRALGQKVGDIANQTRPAISEMALGVRTAGRVLPRQGNRLETRLGRNLGYAGVPGDTTRSESSGKRSKPR